MYKQHFGSILFSIQCGFWKGYSFQLCLYVMLEKLEKWLVWYSVHFWLIFRENWYSLLLAKLFEYGVSHTLFLSMECHIHRFWVWSVTYIVFEYGVSHTSFLSMECHIHRFWVWSVTYVVFEFGVSHTSFLSMECHIHRFWVWNVTYVFFEYGVSHTSFLTMECHIRRFWVWSVTCIAWADLFIIWGSNSTFENKQLFHFSIFQ